MERIVRLLASKFLYIFLGSAFGTILFLIFACLSLGNPIQDLVTSAHKGIIVQPDHKLTQAQIESLNVLLEHQAVIPGEMLIDRLVDFYTSLINQLMAFIAVLSVISYMYIKTSSKEEAQKKASEFMDSDEFANLVKKVSEKEWTTNIEFYADDYASRFDGIDKQISRIRDDLLPIQDAISNLDMDEDEGSSFDLTINKEGE